MFCVKISIQKIPQKNLLPRKLYKKRNFQERDVRKSGVYLNVNEHFKHKRDTKITFLDDFIRSGSND